MKLRFVGGCLRTDRLFVDASNIIVSSDAWRELQVVRAYSDGRTEGPIDSRLQTVLDGMYKGMQTGVGVPVPPDRQITPGGAR